MGSDPTGAFGAIRRRPWVSLLIFLFTLSATLLVTLRANIGFFLDDWMVIVYRRGFTDWLLPHNEHILILPAAIYELTLSVFGMTALPVQLLGLGIFLLSVFLLFLWLRPLVGEPVAVLGSAVVMFLGSSTADLIWPFQIGYAGSIAAGLGALLLLRRGRGRDDIWACLLLVVSLLFGTMVIPFAAAAAVLLLYRDGSPPDWHGLLRSSWVFLTPAALFVIWWLGWGHLAEGHFSIENLVEIPAFVLSALGYNGASLTGLFPLREVTTSFIWVIPGLIVAGAIYLTLKKRRRVPPEFLIAIAALLVFWVLTGLNYSPGREFTASRYQYPGVVFLLMALAGCFAGTRPSRPQLKALAAATVFAVGVNAAALVYTFNSTYKDFEARDLSRLTALDIAQATVNSDHTVPIGRVEDGARVDAESYLETVDRYGSPAWSSSEILEASDENRQRLDRELFRASVILPVPADLLEPVPGSCRMVRAAPDSPEELMIDSNLILIRAENPVIVRFGRFGTGNVVAGVRVERNGPVGYLVKDDRSSVPWRIAFQGSGSVSVCRAVLRGD